MKHAAAPYNSISRKFLENSRYTVKVSPHKKFLLSNHWQDLLCLDQGSDQNQKVSRTNLSMQIFWYVQFTNINHFIAICARFYLQFLFQFQGKQNTFKSVKFQLSPSINSLVYVFHFIRSPTTEQTICSSHFINSKTKVNFPVPEGLLYLVDDGLKLQY